MVPKSLALLADWWSHGVISPWARRRNPPPLGGILGTYIVLKHSPRVFQIRLFALLKWRRLAVRPHSLCEANKPQGTHVVVFESYP